MKDMAMHGLAAGALGRGRVVGSFGIGRQLVLAFGFVLLVMGIFVGGALLQQKAIEASLHEFGAVEIDRIRRVDHWIRISEDAALRFMAVNKSNDPGIQEFLGEGLDAHLQQAEALAAEITAAASTPQEQDWLARFTPIQAALHAARQEVDGYKKIGDAAGASALFDTQFIPAQQAYSAALHQYGQLQRQGLEERLAAVQEAGRRKALFAASAALLMTLLGTVLAWRIVRHIQRSLGTAVHSAECVAQGDLSSTVQVSGSDEFTALMHAMAAMNTGLQCIVGEVRAGTEGIATAAQEITLGNSELSERTQRQALSLEKTTLAMDQLTGAVQRNTATADQADAHARQATDVALQGDAMMAQLVSTMAGIDQASRRIEEIVGVIDGIAFQTNILALNAAVEAARAGAQGRGFAVVAQEVRSLAQSAAQAAREIKVLIADSADKVRTGSTQVEQARDAMQQTVSTIQNVSTLMAELSTAAAEQATDITHVHTCVGALDAITQQNAALVGQATAAAQRLHQQAQRLQATVAAFRLASPPLPKLAG